MKTQLVPEIQKIQSEIDQSRVKLEETWDELRDKVRGSVVALKQDPQLAKKALLLAGAVVVLGLVLFYDRGSKS